MPDSLVLRNTLLGMTMITFAGLTSCNPAPAPPDPSIMVDHGVLDENVENGIAYDRAMVEIGNSKRIVLPDDTMIRRVGDPGKIQLYMAKTLGFVGHPPAKMNMHSARRYMGCAIRREDDNLYIATFGEWDSKKEGGARLKLVAIVPKDAQIEVRKKLSGPESIAQEHTVPKLAALTNGWWYGPVSPVQGWTAIVAIPDPQRMADR